MVEWEKYIEDSVHNRCILQNAESLHQVYAIDRKSSVCAFSFSSKNYNTWTEFKHKAPRQVHSLAQTMWNQSSESSDQIKLDHKEVNVLTPSFPPPCDSPCRETWVYSHYSWSPTSISALHIQQFQQQQVLLDAIFKKHYITSHSKLSLMVSIAAWQCIQLWCLLHWRAEVWQSS